MQQSPPPFNSQFTASCVPSNVASVLTAPQWATEIIDEKSIKQSNQIEKFVNKINLKVETLEVKVNDMSTKVTDVEKSNDFISKEY